MDKLTSTLLEGLDLSDAARGMWDVVLPRLDEALRGGDERPALEAAEDAARSVGVTQAAPLGTLLDGWTAGARRLREQVRARSEVKASDRLLVAIERDGVAHLARGYAGGLEETIAKLRHQAAEASPFDPATGAMKPAQMAGRLSLEVNRCQRMDLSLGLLGLTIDESASGMAACPRDKRDVILQEVGRCVRESLRRYDTVGITGSGAFVLVLPDISRRGLAGAAERLRRDIGDCAAAAPRLLFALAHYDVVDVAPAEMLTALEQGMDLARDVREPLTWV